MPTNWTEVGSLIAGCGLMGSTFLLVTRWIVRDEIRKLNGTYLRSDLAKEKFEQIERHFDYLKDTDR